MRTLMSFLAVWLLTFQLGFAQTTVTGTLLDQDGKPMPMANVSITRYVDLPGFPLAKVVQAEEDGQYAITLDSAGVWEVIFSGVSHSSYEIPLFIKKPEKIHIDVRLKTYDYVSAFTNIKIAGPFNHFNPYSAVPMKENSDGTFTANFETKTDSLFAYDVIGAVPNGTAINGTQSDSYSYDPRWTAYKSLTKPKNGSVRIIFDPQKLVRSDKPAAITFADSESLNAKFARTFTDMVHEQAEWNAAYLQYKSSGKDVRKFKYNWSTVLEDLHERLGRETNGMLRQELYLNYLWIHDFGADVSPSVLAAALKECPPASWIWSLNPMLFIWALNWNHLKEPEFDSMIRTFVGASPCNWNLKALVLEEETGLEKIWSDTGRFAFCYNLLEARYGKTAIGKAARGEYSANLAVADGREAPLFSITSLQDSSKHFTNASFKGKYYMIDFWATWCGPCVGEMKYLQEAYEKFKGKDFEMLSVSLDVSPKDVEIFRNEKWHMPWLQAFAYGGWENKMVKHFETTEIPHPILVNPQGRIVATNNELQGDQLERTLEKYLGN